MNNEDNMKTVSEYVSKNDEVDKSRSMQVTCRSEILGDEIFIPQGEQEELDRKGIKSPVLSDYKYRVDLKDVSNTKIFTNSKERYNEYKKKVKK